MSDKSKVFEQILKEFETENIKLYCKDMIEIMDDDMFTIPSSTSYKYHNKTQCQAGGQLYHVLMVATVMNYMLGLDYMKEKIKEPEFRDCMRVAAILHDAKKTNGGKYTVHEHPVLAQKWIKDTKVENDIDYKYKNIIGRLVASHSGQWAENKRSKIVLPKPEDDAQFFVHLADYIGSRSNLDMIYSKETISEINEFQGVKEVEIPSPEEFVMPFGKHRGMKISEVPIDYIKWLSTTDLNSPLKEIIGKVLN